MKYARILIAAVAALTLALPLSGVADATTAAKQKREIVDFKVPKVHGKYVYTLKIADYASKRVVLERKTCPTCKYRDLKGKKTNLKGVVKFTLAPRTTRGKTSYRTYTPETVNYRKTYGPKVTSICYADRCR